MKNGKNKVEEKKRRVGGERLHGVTRYSGWDERMKDDAVKG